MWKFAFFVTFICMTSVTLIDGTLNKRSIDLIAAHSLLTTDEKLPGDITPNSYSIRLHPSLNANDYTGEVIINATVLYKTNKILLHNDPTRVNITCLRVERSIPVEGSRPENVINNLEKYPDPKWEQVGKQTLIAITANTTFNVGTVLIITMVFKGVLNNETTEGFFRSSYIDAETKDEKFFAATFMRPNLARTVFPCFDEPAYKARFNLTVIRNKEHTVIFNMPLNYTEDHKYNPYLLIDHFQETPPMATYSFALVLSEFNYFSSNVTDTEVYFPDINIKLWSRSDFADALLSIPGKISKSLKFLETFWGSPYPLPALNIFALPNYKATKPSDGWGVLLFKESELNSKGSWHLTQELAYQWLGSLVTPAWWNDAHINNALVRFVTALTTLETNENETFNNWPTTMLYSIYYEFSKRYPHGKNTAIKQDSSSAKTELVFRMLNYTLGATTFRHGMQRFMADRQYKNFVSHDIWMSLTEQAKFDKTLPETITVGEIASSWITKDRLPVVTVTRNYDDNSANIVQGVYLRERPHDVPDQEKYLWWIPIVLIRQDKMNFLNTTPLVWMRKEKEIVLKNLPSKENFIIINPEEIGPFPVNYDLNNWNMLANYLQTSNRTKIPVYTRAKLLHDAWNLAYAGNLSFATALNMTLFLKNEREYLAWDPVFTLIDHIGKHIGSSAVHKKFQMYVRLLLTPLYESLGNEPVEQEPEGVTHLRSSSKVFLCQSGYKPCIAEAQTAFRKWMNSANPDEGNPVANEYICPVFKWGTKEEWEFGLQRIIKFPQSRKPNERTYLLKTLAGCPNDAWKIQRLLNITILQNNTNFSDNDIYLIFSMLTGNANGYTTLFHFLKKHFNEIKIRFEDKPMLWNNIITSATSVFKTQDGLDMVTELYMERAAEFGNADFVIEKSLKKIKEETKWSNDNLPIIEKWLDNYLANNNKKSS